MTVARRGRCQAVRLGWMIAAMIVFGTRRFGAVERVPGVVHVATMFVHVMFLPLVPLQSHVVIDVVFAAVGAALAVAFAVTYPLTRANADQERELRRISNAG